MAKNSVFPTFEADEKAKYAKEEDKVQSRSDFYYSDKALWFKRNATISLS
jgi:hypothetical protein